MGRVLYVDERGRPVRPPKGSAKPGPETTTAGALAAALIGVSLVAGLAIHQHGRFPGTGAQAAAGIRPPGTVLSLAGTSCGGGPSGGTWSIFAHGDADAVAWAKTFLAALGTPVSAANIRFVYDWEASEGAGGKWNPLNQGPVPGRPDLTTTGQQYGGGAADYASCQAGITGAVAYLNMPNYTAVLAAMRHSDYAAAAIALWKSGWAGSHYGYGAAWHSSPAGA
jgi:hypothetical protein